jgi:AAA+ superfamily predicted ATPase
VSLLLTDDFDQRRWLMTHNRLHEAEEIVQRIEASIERQKNITLEMPSQMLTLKIGGLSIRQIVNEILKNYLSRAFLSLALVTALSHHHAHTALAQSSPNQRSRVCSQTQMISQAFFYNVRY